MERFKADLHIHTLLSPCGSLEMSPINIIEAALEQQLDIIAITDHNSTKQAPLIVEMAKEKGLFVIPGCEVNTSEEVHCLTLFETIDQLNDFQFFLDQHLLPIPNKPDTFGDQVVVDREEMIIEEEKYLLINALDATLAEVEQKAHELKGLVIPAHVDRPFNGLFSQLGFMPTNLKVDGFELSRNSDLHQWKSSGKIPHGSTFIRSSDAHIPNQIGQGYSWMDLEKLSFSEIRLAFSQRDGRKIVPANQ